MVHSTADKISEGDFEDRLKLATTKSCLKSFFKLEFKPKLIHYHDHLYYSTLKLLRAIAISVHMLCLLHIYCTMVIAAFKTNILLCYELLEGTCHIREYAVSSIFLFDDFL